MYGALRSLDYEAMGEFFRTGRTLELLARPRRNEATHWDHVMFLKRLPKDIRARLVRGCDVLEFGCGTGKWLTAMRREFPKSWFHGVDPDPETGAEVGFAETAGTAASADIVYLGEVLHLTDRPKTLPTAPGCSGREGTCSSSRDSCPNASRRGNGRRCSSRCSSTRRSRARDS
jgi:hypothetical protein